MGKTTSALNVAAELSRNGNKVLLIDVDPQGNLSKSLLPKDAESLKHTIFTLFLRECTLDDVDLIVHSIFFFSFAFKRTFESFQVMALSLNGS